MLEAAKFAGSQPRGIQKRDMSQPFFAAVALFTVDSEAAFQSSGLGEGESRRRGGALSLCSLLIRRRGERRRIHSVRATPAFSRRRVRPHRYQSSARC